jgi:subtilase family serine protease
VQDSASPNFHRFLTPEEFGRHYGPSDGDLNTIQTWLRSHGLTVAKVSRGRTAIEFSGTVDQVEQTFHTSIHQYVRNGSAHWMNTTNPMIPAALAPVVAGVTSLTDLKPRPQILHGPVGHWDSTRGRFEPSLTVSVSNQDYLFMSPGDAATVYDAPNSFNSLLSAGQAVLDGTGVTIGVVEDAQPDLGNLNGYQQLFGLPQKGVNIVVDGDPDSANFDPNAKDEEILDIQVAQGLAPGAQLNLYTAADTVFQSGVFLAALRAVDDNAVNILSVSYGECEADLGAASNLEIFNAWEQAAAQGITVLASSGDSGSAGCDDPSSETVAVNGLAVSGVASTPFDIAVGGTDFAVLSTGFSTYVSPSTQGKLTSVLQYIPEDAWNDSAQTPGLLATNTPLLSSGQTNIIGGGGGSSSTAGYTKPGWQQGFAASSGDNYRDLPDVSLFSGEGRYRAVWAICEDGDCLGADSTIHGVGGTSAAAPAFAGILAMVNQKVGASTRLGQADWVLYQLAQTTPSAFHSMANSNNAVVCSSGSPNCGANGFLTGYNVAAGYSQATGLGSVDITKLVNAWGSDALVSTTTTLSLDKTSFAHGTLVNITAAVAPGDATGTVAVVNNAGAQAGAQNSTAGRPLGVLHNFQEVTIRYLPPMEETEATAAAPLKPQP